MTERHTKNGNIIFKCARCESTLNPRGRPIEALGVYYVEAATERNPLETTVPVALDHTDKTRALRDYIASERGMRPESANMALARGDKSYMPQIAAVRDSLDIPAEWITDSGTVVVPPSAYPTRQDVDPEVEKDNPDVAAVVAKEVTFDEPALLLICEACLEDGDQIIWQGDLIDDKNHEM